MLKYFRDAAPKSFYIEVRGLTQRTPQEIYAAILDTDRFIEHINQRPPLTPRGPLAE
jgi:hypothetical protein